MSWSLNTTHHHFLSLTSARWGCFLLKSHLSHHMIINNLSANSSLMMWDDNNKLMVGFSKYHTFFYWLNILSLILASYHHYNNDTMKWDDINNDRQLSYVFFVSFITFFLLTNYFVILNWTRRGKASQSTNGQHGVNVGMGRIRGQG